MKKNVMSRLAFLSRGLQFLTVPPPIAFTLPSIRVKRSHKELDWNDDLGRVLFRCWIETATNGAWRKSLKYFCISMGMAFLAGFFNDHALTERLKVVLPIMMGFTTVAVIVHFLYILLRPKMKTTNFYYIALPRKLWELDPLEKIGKPKDLKNLSDADFVRFLMDRFKEEFSYRTERLRNISALILAASVFMGVWRSNDNGLAELITIISSYAIIVSYHISGVTQRAMSYFKYRVLLLEN